MAAPEQGKITDEGVAKLRGRIGKGFEGRRPWRTEITRDAIYHRALAIGDRIRVDSHLKKMREKDSTFGSGRA